MVLLLKPSLSQGAEKYWPFLWYELLRVFSNLFYHADQISWRRFWREDSHDTGFILSKTLGSLGSSAMSLPSSGVGFQSDKYTQWAASRGDAGWLPVVYNSVCLHRLSSCLIIFLPITSRLCLPPLPLPLCFCTISIEHGVALKTSLIASLSVKALNRVSLTNTN